MEKGVGQDKVSAYQQSEAQPKRTDYPLRTDEVPNGDRRPIEVYQFAEIMRKWREQSSQSTALVR